MVWFEMTLVPPLSSSSDIPVLPVSNSCICGILECTTLIYFTNLLVWFSLVYSTTRLCLICHFLLYHTEEGDDESSDQGLQMHSLHRVRRKHCLWEIAGMIIIAYEAILSFVLCVGTGSFVFEVKGFFVFIWCLNYPVFLIFHWVLGFFLTKCCVPQRRMRRSSFYNCGVVIINLFWRGVLYWCALNLMFHPAIRSNNGNGSGRMEMNIVKTINEGVRLMTANITMISSITPIISINSSRLIFNGTENSTALITELDI